MKYSRRRHPLQRTGLLAAGLAWLLLSAQLPWHTGMQAGQALANKADAAGSIQLACGPALKRADLARLTALGLLFPVPTAKTHGLNLCELFAGLITPLSVPIKLTLPPAVAPVSQPVAWPAFVPVALYRLPPSHAPPALR